MHTIYLLVIFIILHVPALIVVHLCCVCPIVDFYDEVLALLDLFTSVSISPQAWSMLAILYDMFTRDGFDYFSGECLFTSCSLQVLQLICIMLSCLMAGTQLLVTLR